MLSSCNPRASSFISFLVVISLLFPRNRADTQIKSNCTGTAYTTGGTFDTNLGDLFSSLIASSAASNSNNATSGATGPDPAYGLYLCEGDLSGLNCQACVQKATVDIVGSCPKSSQGIIWYNYCQLRYSDHAFFAFPDTNGFSMTRPNDTTDSPVPFAMVSELVQAAPFRPLMFASNASVADSRYALAQCTADLSSAGCSKCLNTILASIKACCTGWNGWRFLAYSCWIRYEATPFLQNLTGVYTEIVDSQCSNNNFSLTGLDYLLSNLTAEAGSTGFYSTSTAGDRLYGLALCRGDLATPGDACQSCLDDARSTLVQDCPNKTEGLVWYERCLLRYSNQTFFGTVDGGGHTFCGQGKVDRAADTATASLASRLVGMASSSPSLFAAGEETVGTSLSSYVFAQCTRDLSSEGCNSCLQNGMAAVASKCKLMNGWRYLSGSCMIRYENFAFFDTSAITTTSAMPTPNAKGEGSKKDKSKVIVAAIVAPILGVIVLSSILYILRRRLKRKTEQERSLLDEFTPLPSRDLPSMDLAVIQAATSNFSDTNKLGEGGFGSVYKGMLPDGREIAVKRLSAKSKQGATEFKNEVKLIAKLQHRNLVRMLGFCVEREEKLLIYEYLPNNSLDTFLFDPNKSSRLDWKRRTHIIEGIARGLLYLHEDSLLKVIHMDLKAGNVLLDNEMNAKISDFGMAKIFELDESEATTSRRIGTYGYMAPEHAMDGLVSVKSDVYSFGVLLLEILSGQKNGRSHFEQYGQTLLRHAWHLWNEGRAIELMDPILQGTYSENEAMKHIHIGLLCVQEDPAARTTMSSIVHMLRNEQIVLSQPTQPPTFFRRSTPVSGASQLSTKNHSTNANSINEVTNTDIQGR